VSILSDVVVHNDTTVWATCLLSLPALRAACGESNHVLIMGDNLFTCQAIRNCSWTIFFDSDDVAKFVLL